MNRMKFSGSAVFGIILIAIGLVSLLSGLNYFDSWTIFSTYWPLVVILFGLKSLIDYRSSSMFGLIVIAVGVFLQLDLLGLWYLGDINVKELIVPVIIILIGLKFVLPRGLDREEQDHREEVHVEPMVKVKVDQADEDASDLEELVVESEEVKP